MSADDLQPNELYVLLYIRDDPPKPDDCHWALYHHINHDTGGLKYHIRGISNHWITDHSNIKGVTGEIFLIGLVQIGVIPKGREQYVDQTLRSIDHTINNRDITCRIWLRRVLDLLTKSDGGSPVLKCADGEALEREVKDWGNENFGLAARNEQPRPIGKSKLCGL